MCPRRLYLCLFLLLSVSLNNIQAQNIPIGTWQDHLSYRDAITVTEANGIIYCASSSALFSYDLSDFSINRLNLVNGLSDIGINKVKFNPFNNRLLVAYSNGNVDVILEDKSIINISHIKNSNVIGDKTINNIYLSNHLAYLSTGFGIVVLDMDRLEIQDTYLIGNLGTYINVNDLTMDSLKIYAATDGGVYAANRSAANLADYNEWSKVTQLKDSAYSNIEYFNKALILIQDRGNLADSIFIGTNNTWQAFTSETGNTVNLCLLQQDAIGIVWEWGVSFYDNSYNKYAELSGYAPHEIIRASNFHYWMADFNKGLVHLIDPWNPDIEFISPNSPSSSSVFNIDIIDDDLWFVSGGLGVQLSKNLVNHKINGSWSNMGSTMLDANGFTARDMVNVVINPSNTSQVYVSSWSSGLYEYNNETVTNIYNGQNSALDSVFFGITAISGMAFDQDDNLWVSSSYAANYPLAVKTSDNTWYNYSLSGSTTPSDYYTHLIVDANGYKWMIATDAHKIIVFDDNGTLDNKSDDRTVVTKNFPGAKIYCITEDRDGEIWVGTDVGVAVFYNPSAVFDENIEGEQIFIQQDGQTQILLESATVRDICTDGANRKWIATQNSGVFLMSADGTEEVEHFTTENSPLFSNTVFDIEINHKTGEVFFATEKGLISYKGTATEPQSDFDVFVYPNPVKPDYEGVIAIRGLVKDTDVRITDVAGNIVFETTSLGGQAIWDGKDFHGNRVQSGVYMVFNGSPEGNLKAAAKILFLN